VLRAEIERYLECRRLGRWLHEDERSTAIAAAIRRRLWLPADSRPVARLRDRLLNRLGYLHERRGEFDEALESYALSSSHPARERRARLLRRLGDERGFTALVAAARRSPWSAEEEDYALRCAPTGTRGDREGKPIVTELGLDPLDLEQGVCRYIEQHALSLLCADGAHGWHVENHLPLGLAGLLFWEEIFAPVPGAFSHPLQQGPRDLFWPDFAQVRAAAIEARGVALQDAGILRAELLRIHGQKTGIANRLVHWGVWTPEFLDGLLELRDTRGLLAIARHAIGDLQRARTGFPDLTVVGRDGELEFVEVKGPGDQLQPAQRTWLRTLARLDLPARVLKFRQ